jgi:hypothetical protein
MRLPKVEHGHDAASKAILARIEAEAGYVDGVTRILLYRPELFGSWQKAAANEIMQGPSEWSTGERELMAAFVSAQNQCPF